MIVTRCSSMFDMLLKYQRIREPTSQCLEFPVTVLELIPSAQENGTVNETVEHLKNFESVSKILQGGGDNRISVYTVLGLYLMDFSKSFLKNH